MSTDNNAVNNTSAHMIEEGSYANLVTSGKGYLNNPRWYDPQNGESSLWLTINAQCGIAKKNKETGRVGFSTTPIDCKVVGDELIDLVNGLMEEYDFSYNSQNRPTIKVGFRIGDIYPTSFEKTKGQNAGKTVLVLKGRLFQIAWMYVNGELVYGEPLDASQDSEQADDPASVQPEQASVESDSDNADSDDEGTSVKAENPFDEELGDVVELDPKDSGFDAKKAYLKAHGYDWNGKTKSWFRAQEEAA